MNQTLSKTLVVAGVALFLYQLGELLGSHSTWAEFQSPAGVGELVKLLGGVVLAIVGALGTDIPKFLGGLKKSGPAIILAVALGGGAIASTGCAARTSGAQTDPRAALLQAIHQAETVGILTRGLVETEIAFYQGGKITADRHRVFMTAAKTFASATLAALDAAKSLNKPDAGTRDAIIAALKLADSLLAQGIAPIENPDVRATLRAAVASIQAILILTLGS